MDFKIKDNIALVTASTKGLGRGCAEQLAREGCKVAICSRNEQQAKTAAQEISKKTGAKVFGFAANMSNPEEITRLIQSVQTYLGDPDILVTNAGGPAPGTFANTARAGLTGFLKTVSTELAPNGITVNAILPGIHKTDRIKQLAEHRSNQENRLAEDIIQEMMDDNPSKILGDSSDFGAMAGFLVHTEASVAEFKGIDPADQARITSDNVARINGLQLA